MHDCIWCDLWQSMPPREWLQFAWLAIVTVALLTLIPDYNE